VTEAASNAELDARIAEWRPDLLAALRGLYGDRADDLCATLEKRACEAASQRSDALTSRDRARAVQPDWYQSNERVGYMAYADRFGGTLDGVRGRIPHLVELGVDVLHLLSLLTPRDGESDGGFAIRDYANPDPRLGTVDELRRLISDLHAAGISLCVDFVLNHTSEDHEWALAARAGSAYHRDLYLTFRDRTEPDAYEQTLPEIFPDMSPGNFTWIPEMDRWVWTTFRDFQWDLNWANPDVMTEVVDLAFHLANLGVDVLRLDAIAFTWKRLGTNCQNQPEAHLVAQALRAALGIAAPSTILLAEAIVGPNDLVGYLGRHELERRECELAYHNQLMVQAWSMLATKKANLARVALGRLPDPPARSTWFTYVRCHDDIGWAIDDADAAAVGVTGFGHRAFLAAFYRGDFWESFAQGTPFGTNPATNDERTSGMAATLAGVSAALDAGDPAALDAGIERVLLLYGIAFGYGGIPIVYMGDELCMLDDATYLDDPLRRADSRWCHRPTFDERVAARRNVAGSPEQRLWHGMRQLIAARRACLPLHGATTSRPVDVGQPAVFAWHRAHPRYGELLGLANTGDDPVAVTPPVVLGTRTVGLFDHLAPGDERPFELAPRQVRWIGRSAGLATVPAATASAHS
jgi:amylosucrase